MNEYDDICGRSLVVRPERGRKWKFRLTLWPDLGQMQAFMRDVFDERRARRIIGYTLIWELVEHGVIGDIHLPMDSSLATAVHEAQHAALAWAQVVKIDLSRLSSPAEERICDAVAEMAQQIWRALGRQ